MAFSGLRQELLGAMGARKALNSVMSLDEPWRGGDFSAYVLLP